MPKQTTLQLRNNPHAPSLRLFSVARVGDHCPPPTRFSWPYRVPGAPSKLRLGGKARCPNKPLSNSATTPVPHPCDFFPSQGGYRCQPLTPPFPRHLLQIKSFPSPRPLADHFRQIPKLRIMNPAHGIRTILAATKQLLDAKCAGQIDDKTFDQQLKSLEKEANRIYAATRAMVLRNRLMATAKKAKTTSTQNKTRNLPANY